MDKKKNVAIESLCKGLPKEFENLMRYSRELGFTDPIDYDYLNGMFEELADKL